MDKRLIKREEIGKVTILSIKVENKASILIDLSLDGFQLIIPFSPEKHIVQIKLEMKSKEYNFNGYIHWSSRSIIKLNWYQVGVSIMDPSEELIEEINKILTVY